MDSTVGYVPTLLDFEQMAHEMQRDHVLFEGRMIQGRIIHGAFIADRAEDQAALAAAAEEGMKNLSQMQVGR